MIPTTASSSLANITKAKNYDRSIYYKLRSMFPDVKASYIKQICPPPLDDLNAKPNVVRNLVDHLLVEGQNHLRALNKDFVEPQAATILNIDEQYEYLSGILPDADPTYLRQFLEENKNKENFLEEFIQEKLEKLDYPTKKEYLAKIRVTEQIKEYTDNFNIEKFLQMFPDPFKHFENEERVCVQEPIAKEFLKSYFSKNKVNTIGNLYRKNKYNISLTAKALTNKGPDMLSRRKSVEMPMENIPLLQEITFIKHKESIASYINSKKIEEEILFIELKEKKLLLTCQCCFNDECMPINCVRCKDNHVFCSDCLVRGTEMVLAKGKSYVKCFIKCNQRFSLATLQKFLSPTIFSILLKHRQADEVMAAKIEGLVSCPFCYFASIPPAEDKVFKCLNPECMKETCRQCKALNHVPLRCDEVLKPNQARLLVEEKMTEALLKTCYRCKLKFFKEEGCNKMQCTCGALMCYICDKPISDYKHFNPQGGQNTHLCPLWSDNKRLNAKAVIKVAKELEKMVLKENPNLQINTEALMPKLPPKVKGPHNHIPNANQVPAIRVQRVVEP